MKIILNEKYLVPFEHLEDILEVKSVGGWGSGKFEIIGEPSDVQIVKDDSLVFGEAADKISREQAEKDLKDIKKVNEDLSLYKARAEAVKRILAESKISRANAEAWVETQSAFNLEYSFNISNVKQWIEAQKEQS